MAVILTMLINLWQVFYMFYPSHLTFGPLFLGILPLIDQTSYQYHKRGVFDRATNDAILRMESARGVKYNTKELTGITQGMKNRLIIAYYTAKRAKEGKSTFSKVSLWEKVVDHVIKKLYANKY